MQLPAVGSAWARSFKACRRCPAPVLAPPSVVRISLTIGFNPKRSHVHDNTVRRVRIAASASREDWANGLSPEPSLSGNEHARPSAIPQWLTLVSKALGIAGLMVFAMMSGPTRAAQARDRATPAAQLVTVLRTTVNSSQKPILAAASATTESVALPAAPVDSPSSLFSTVEASYRSYLERIIAQVLEESPGLSSQPEVLMRVVRARALGTPLSFDELMRSSVPAPQDVPVRNSRQEVADQIEAILDQYDNEDFDLGIKQFMLETKVENKLEAASLGTTNDQSLPQEFEEALAAELFASEAVAPRGEFKTEDIVDDAFTTEVVEEALALFGDANSVRTAWRTKDVLTELSYTQMWALVEEGHVGRVRFYGPESNKVIVTMKASAPGGRRVCKVVLLPDPELLEHLTNHGVLVDAGTTEEDRLTTSLFVQVQTTVLVKGMTKVQR